MEDVCWLLAPPHPDFQAIQLTNLVGGFRLRVSEPDDDDYIITEPTITDPYALGCLMSPKNFKVLVLPPDKDGDRSDRWLGVGRATAG